MGHTRACHKVVKGCPYSLFGYKGFICGWFGGVLQKCCRRPGKAFVNASRPASTLTSP